MQEILDAARSLFDDARNLRRELHQHPELGFREERTARRVVQELEALGLEVAAGVGKTGVMATLEGAQPGPQVLLRFDMDALPIQEETGASYASQVPGVMHACGHDGHVAIGLMAAKLLSARQAELAGSVRFVFQPAEEGLGGAQAMLADGALGSPKPDQVLAVHLWNEKPLGWLGISPGPVMAAGDIFHIQVTGKGGHGALPHLAQDPVVAAATIVTALQSVVTRNLSPLAAAVVSVTSLHGGEAFNVIPSSVEMKGTIRTFEAEARRTVLERFRRMVTDIASAHACTATIELTPLTPAVVNDAGVAQRMQSLARRLFPDFDLETNYRSMVSEDMAFFLEQAPGCFIFVGSANPERGLDASHHHPTFDFDEQALIYGLALLVGATLDALRPSR
ncbi:MAG: amidohydrolase [Anaerolineales bacterium]|nr:amidohydrolase [Anaerolineales bacterium]